MFELPTRSDRRYSGKYPNNVWSVSYGSSPSQDFVGLYLNIERPVHLELNCGRRFIAAMSELKINEPLLGRDISQVTLEEVTPIEPLSQERYNGMLGGLRQARGYSKETT